jgi:hypothetical protein
MADVLTPEQLEAARNGQDPNKVEQTVTTTEAPVAPVVEQKEGAGEQPAPTDAIMASPGDPYTFDAPSQSGKGINKITIAKPTRPVALHITKILGFDATNDGMLMYFRSMAWITHINGMPLPTPLYDRNTTRQDFESLAELLGDEALDTLVIEVSTRQLIQKVVSADDLKKS